MKWVDWHDEGNTPEEGAVFIEGLPGIGHVGQLAAQHIVDVLKGKPWARIHSPDFPPQALVQEDGTVDLCSLKLWSVPARGDAPALVIMTGDTQPLSPQGQYFIAQDILSRLNALGCKRLYTLGGVMRPDSKDVVGAATNTELVDQLKGHGVKFEPHGPDGGILGASGVFLGLGKLVGIQGGCIMGNSDGSLVDEAAAERLLTVLAPVLGREISLEGLDKSAERVAQQLHVFDDVRYYAAPNDQADHHYIG